MSAPTFRVGAVDLFERPVALRMPFRFGVVTLTHAPQAFVRVRLEFADGRASSAGAAAELMVPKWFDKDPALSNDDNVDQLRSALLAARDAYVDGAARTAFGHFVAHHVGVIDACAAHRIPPLAANLGPALVDRAILDALGHALDASFYQLLQRDLAGIEAVRAAPDLAGFDAKRFLAGIAVPASVAARHTVGLADRLDSTDPGAAVGDGLPETLEEVVTRYGHRFYKLKVAGQPDADFSRLQRIARVLDVLPEYEATLDGNEQYADVRAVAGLLQRLAGEPGTRRLARSVLFVEQPVPRATALEVDVRALAALKPVIIDESDAALDAFVAARSCGYTGISSKACKGVYRSLLNAMRCAQWNAQGGPDHFFLSGEDLTTQAGLAVQQDLALAAALGITHVERNGHHYVNGFAGQRAPEAEQEAFLAAHPDFYERSHGGVRLRISAGNLRIGSLAKPGFASGAEPQWSTLEALHAPRPSRRRPHEAD